jgi:hypothetical protein
VALASTIPIRAEYELRLTCALVRLYLAKLSGTASSRKRKGVSVRVQGLVNAASACILLTQIYLT